MNRHVERQVEQVVRLRQVVDPCEERLLAKVDVLEKRVVLLRGRGRHSAADFAARIDRAAAGENRGRKTG